MATISEGEGNRGPGLCPMQGVMDIDILPSSHYLVDTAAVEVEQFSACVFCRCAFFFFVLLLCWVFLSAAEECHPFSFAGHPVSALWDTGLSIVLYSISTYDPLEILALSNDVVTRLLLTMAESATADLLVTS